MRSQAHCLVFRTGHLGEEARDRAGQRQVFMAREERARREDEAHFAAYDWGSVDMSNRSIRPIDMGNFQGSAH